MGSTFDLNIVWLMASSCQQFKRERRKVIPIQTERDLVNLRRTIPIYSARTLKVERFLHGRGMWIRMARFINIPFYGGAA